MKKNGKTLIGIGLFIGLVILCLPAAILYLLYYGYKLAFYYKDPKASPYDYEDNEQSRSCKKVWDAAITKFRSVPSERVSITSDDGLKLTGHYYHVKDGAPLEIQCHGYKGNAIRDFCGNWKIAADSGRNVLLIDERAHGDSEGHTITFGILERTDVPNWVKFAGERFGNVPILLSGVSMGAATVLMTASMDLPENVKGIIADCPYDAPSNIIKKVLGTDMGMPVKFVYPLIRLGGMLYGKFNLDAASPVEAVKETKVPILLIHGDDDRFVPYNMSCSIHAANPDMIEFHTIHGAGHAMNYASAPDEYMQIVKTFTERVLG
ncbi:MAG: alpha/beta hydrolase [Lachnospiraceae bacterium]|nr:alpha/beta hydrolase [Lachnospiraceae bacterium]